MLWPAAKVIRSLNKPLSCYAFFLRVALFLFVLLATFSPFSLSSVSLAKKVPASANIAMHYSANLQYLVSVYYLPV